MLQPEEAHLENQVLDMIWSSSGDLAMIQKLSAKTKMGKNSSKYPDASWLIGNPHFNFLHKLAKSMMSSSSTWLNIFGASLLP